MNQLNFPFFENPPCSKWSLWLGKEVEGTLDVGKQTLFVRFASLSQIYEAIIAHKVTRVWFCEEYNDWADISYLALSLANRGIKPMTFCFSVLYSNLPKFPLALKSSLAANGVVSQIYLRVPVTLAQLSQVDQVCVGMPYNDVIFSTQLGLKMSPADYSEDVCLIE
jgi:hypothetical protein